MASTGRTGDTRYTGLVDDLERLGVLGKRHFDRVYT